MLDLGVRLGDCVNCSYPVHEADITDGYAEACEGGYRCAQPAYTDSCREHAIKCGLAAANAADAETAAPLEGLEPSTATLTPDEGLQVMADKPPAASLTEGETTA